MKREKVYNLRTKLIFLIICINLLSYATFSHASPEKIKLQAPLFDNLGPYHRKIKTSVPLAQRFFDQGMVFFYGFEWSEAVRSFKEATRLDPNCGMCYWGLALALGYKANAPMTGNEYNDARAAIEKAKTLLSHETPIERAYILALSLRFKQPLKQSSISSRTFSCHTTNSENISTKQKLSYTNAMKKIAAQYMNDNDAKAIYAYALFDLADWKFWEKGKMNPYTLYILRSLKASLKKDKLHIGANHYYIHVIEESSRPEDALMSANRFKTLVPGSEHLVHMPTHIYFLTGRYHEASESNLQAITAYQKYSKISRAQGFEPEITYLYHHNFDFLRTTATMEGRKQLAITAAQQLMKNIPASWIEHDPQLQWFIPIPYYVQARFGMWHDILKQPMPKTNYQYALGMWHYAYGMAFIKTNDFKNAEAHAAKLQEIIQKGANDSTLGEKGISLLTLANEVLAAMFANAHFDEESTFDHLKKAIQIQYEMGYHEPPDWYFPVTEILGDAYLKWGYPKEAIIMYQQDLKQYPNNGWALYGLAKSLRKLGENEKAAHAEQAFKNAWKYADIPAPVSLFSFSASSFMHNAY